MGTHLQYTGGGLFVILLVGELSFDEFDAQVEGLAVGAALVVLEFLLFGFLAEEAFVVGGEWEASVFDGHLLHELLDAWAIEVEADVPEGLHDGESCRHADLGGG